MTQGRILINGPLTEEIIKDHEAKGQLRNDNPDPVQKDNLVVPNHGYAVVRFLADNPG